ncbi:MAG: zf-HC2 domain-containing protein [Acidobacteria bacterium]|nr:MAG: zf-HC2 domain-containing protein [Acidobacteriota bacterium]
MPIEERDNCVTPEELVDYFDHNLAQDQELQLEEHLGECDRCAGLAREVFQLSSEWEQWTAKTHGEACVSEPGWARDLLGRALDRISNTIGPQAVERWKKGAEGAVRVVVRQMATSEIITEGVDTLLRPNASWHFVPIEISPRGGAKRGQGPRAVIQVESPESGPEARRARVGIELATGDISVSFDNFPPGRPYPRVLLIPLKGEVDPEKPEWRPLSLPGAETVEFSGLEPGEYFIAFEPVESAEGEDR